MSGKEEGGTLWQRRNANDHIRCNELELKTGKGGADEAILGCEEPEH